MSGSVLFNGAPLCAATRHHVAFVHQNHCCLGSLSVRETLRFAAQLRMEPTSDAWEHEMAVDDQIAKLWLSSCADSLVNVISGGERRRLAIGVELINKPPVIFLDEARGVLRRHCGAPLLFTSCARWDDGGGGEG